MTEVAIAPLRSTQLLAQNRWTACAWLLAACVCISLAHFVLGIPLQVWDSYGNLAQIVSIPFDEAVKKFFEPGRAYYRPLLWLALKVVADLSGGHYYVWYKGVQILQIIVAVALFLRLLRVRTVFDAAAAALALSVLIGIHTFNNTVRETFPINTFMTIVIACLAAANLAISRGGLLVDAAATALLVFATLTVESGLMVWVIFVTAYVAGLRGVSRRAIAITTALTAAYLVARFVVLDIGGPGLAERSTGFGFRMLEPNELIARFGARVWPFYLYNVVGNMSSLLFAEPRAGVFVLASSLLTGADAEWRVMNVLASTLASALIGWFGVRRIRAWYGGGDLTLHDRLAVTAFGVAGANAILGYAYSKDVIMSPAGVFYALVVYGAARELLAWLSLPARSRLTVTSASVFLAVLAFSWAVRFVGLHWALREQAFRVREDWATVDQELPSAGLQSNTVESRALKWALQEDALFVRPFPPDLVLPIPRRWFDEDY